MNDTIDFINTQWQNYAEALNDQIGNTLINLIDKEINLTQIIEDDNVKRLEELNKALESTDDEDIKAAMKYYPIEFTWIRDKLEYALKALYHRWLVVNHNVFSNGTVEFKFYNVKSTYKYILEWNYTASIKEFNS